MQIKAILMLLLATVESKTLLDNTNDGETVEELCSLFSSNQTNFEFYSPLYPKNYPPNIQCFKTIEAPPGHVIRLNFVENFNIEDDESCKYDYLEIRDGEFGYSSLIQKCCGNKNPPSYIESSGRFLWLRFKSDQDIEYIGFKITYQFVPQQQQLLQLGDGEETCGEIFLNVNQGNMSSLSISNELKEMLIHGQGGVDCTWIIETDMEDHKIFLQFPSYELEKPNDCTFNFVEVYGSRTELEGDEGRLKQFCGSEADSVTSKGTKLHVRFVSGFHTNKQGKVVLKSKFAAVFNLFRELKDGQQCQQLKEFDCTDGTCIALNLKCNGDANCKFRNDEDESCQSGKGRFKLTTDILIIAFLGILLMAGMCSGLMLNIYRKLKEDKETLAEMRETLQKSRESMVVRVQQPMPMKVESSSSSSASKETVVQAASVVTPRYIPPSPYNSKVMQQVRDSSSQTKPADPNEIEFVQQLKTSPDFIFRS